MRAKRYFWNMKHHRELDRKMGLSRRMAEPFARLAEACGMDTELAGTQAMMPIFLSIDHHDKLTPKKMRPLIIYDCLSNEIPHRFHRCRLGVN